MVMPAQAASYCPHFGVHLVLIKGRKVLLLRRANTGSADGSWSVPGGSLEDGETLWAGEPANAEPDKCAEIAWHEIGELPDDIVGYVRVGLQAYDQGNPFSLDNWQANRGRT